MPSPRSPGPAAWYRARWYVPIGACAPLVGRDRLTLEVVMNVGVLLVFQNWHENMSDEEMFLNELRLGEMAEALGYDSVWSVEHHFDDYSMCPDATQSLSYLAGQ